MKPPMKPLRIFLLGLTCLGFAGLFATLRDLYGLLLCAFFGFALLLIVLPLAIFAPKTQQPDRDSEEGGEDGSKC